MRFKPLPVRPAVVGRERPVERETVPGEIQECLLHRLFVNPIRFVTHKLILPVCPVTVAG